MFVLSVLKYGSFQNSLRAETSVVSVLKYRSFQNSLSLMENEFELKYFVLSAIKYGRYQSLHSPLNCVRVCLYKRGRSSPANTPER